MTPGRANPKTVAAANTLLRQERNFGAELLAFRVVTPCAIEGAAFEKNGCSYSRTVMNRKFLYIEDQTGPIAVVHASNNTGMR